MYDCLLFFPARQENLRPGDGFLKQACRQFCAVCNYVCSCLPPSLCFEIKSEIGLRVGGEGVTQLITNQQRGAGR